MRESGKWSPTSQSTWPVLSTFRMTKTQPQSPTARNERRNIFRDKIKVPRIDTIWSFRSELWLRHCRAHQVVFEVHVTQPPSRSSFKVLNYCLAAERSVRSLNLDRASLLTTRPARPTNTMTWRYRYAISLGGFSPLQSLNPRLTMIARAARLYNDCTCRKLSQNTLTFSGPLERCWS